MLTTSERQQVLACQSDIEWLLRDEYVSCLRHMLPVTALTLDKVARHVETSSERTCCRKKHVKLQFVYGAQQSFPHFIEVRSTLIAASGFESFHASRNANITIQPQVKCSCWLSPLEI